MKTLQQIKEQVAIKNHFSTWKQLIRSAIVNSRPSLINECLDEVATMYAEESISESLEVISEWFPIIQQGDCVAIDENIKHEILLLKQKLK